VSKWCWRSLSSDRVSWITALESQVDEIRRGEYVFPALPLKKKEQAARAPIARAPKKAPNKSAVVSEVTPVSRPHPLFLPRPGPLLLPVPRLAPLAHGSTWLGGRRHVHPSLPPQFPNLLPMLLLRPPPPQLLPGSATSRCASPRRKQLSSPLGCQGKRSGPR